MQHEWVLIIQCPVSVIEDTNGSMIKFVDPQERELAELNAVYGCKNCDQPLTDDHPVECVGANVH